MTDTPDFTDMPTDVAYAWIAAAVSRYEATLWESVYNSQRGDRIETR